MEDNYYLLKYQIPRRFGMDTPIHVLFSLGLDGFVFLNERRKFIGKTHVKGGRKTYKQTTHHKEYEIWKKI